MTIYGKKPVSASRKPVCLVNRCLQRDRHHRFSKGKSKPLSENVRHPQGQAADRNRCTKQCKVAPAPRDGWSSSSSRTFPDEDSNDAQGHGVQHIKKLGMSSDEEF